MHAVSQGQGDMAFPRIGAGLTYDDKFRKMTDTDIDRQDTALEKEIVTAIKDIARKKAVLSSFEQAALAKDTRRRRLVRGLSGVAAALVGVALLYVFLPAKTTVSSPDAGACIRGGEMASPYPFREIWRGPGAY